MKKLMALLLTSAVLLSACGNSNTPATPGTSSGGTTTPPAGSSGGTTTTPTQPAGSNPMYNDYKTVYSSEVTSLNYLTSSLSTITEITYTLVDGLIDFDNYGLSKPALATSYSVSDDGKVYTFKLREGVKWYTYDKKEYADVTAHDFVTGLQMVLTKDNASTTSNIVYNVVAGAKDYFDGKTTDFSTVGIKAIDDYTVEYTLNEPTPYFVSMTTYSCWLPINKEFIDEIGGFKAFGTSNDTLLYNGAYILTTWEPEARRIREANENYWDKDNTPIKKMTNTFNKEAANIQTDLFLKGDIVSTSIPTAIVDEWLADPVKKNMMARLPVSSYSWQMVFNFEPLYAPEYKPEEWAIAVQNLNFRKAFFHSMDNERYVKSLDPHAWQDKVAGTVILKGMFSVDGGGDYVDLPALKQYQPLSNFDVAKATEYKTKAMEELKGKVNFPIPVVYPHSTTTANAQYAQVLEQMWEENLGKDFIDVILVPYAPTGFNTETRSKGRYSIMALGWGPDFADPASCFEIYEETSSIGPAYGRTYKAEGFDEFQKLLDTAKAERLDMNKRLELFAQAEAFIIENAYSIPSYRTGGGFIASYKDMFSANCTQFGRNDNKVTGLKLLDKPMNMEEYEAALAKWEAEKAEKMKDPMQNWK